MSDLKNFKQEQTTVWSFPERGKWSTHNPKYRGNFAPQIARNIILRYSMEGDTVLDPMMGGGTTLIETKLLNRRGIGFDINPKAVEITKKLLNFKGSYKYEPKVRVGNIKKLSAIKDESVDLVLTHPPYLNTIKYSEGKIEEDLSNITGVNKFCDQFEKGIKELKRVLKEDEYCAILMGDTRKGRHYVPLSNYVMQRFLDNGFALKEDIIKLQHNCSSTPYWSSKSNDYNFLLIMHEHLFVFRKIKRDEKLSRIRYSIKR